MPHATDIKGQTDDNLIQLIAAGSVSARDQAIEVLYWRWAARLKRYFTAHGAGPSSCEDILQETFLKIWRGASGLKDSERAASWIWTIARNTHTDHVRRIARAPRMESMDPENRLHEPKAEDPYDVETDDCITRGLNLFADSHPERAYALELWSSGMDLQSLSEVIGRSYGATRQFLLECRKKIRPFLSPCFETPES